MTKKTSDRQAEIWQSTAGMEIGDLTPIRGVLDWIDERLEQEKGMRPEDDAGALALREVRKRLDESLAAATNADLELTVEQYAELQGVSTWAVYKRIKAGTVPGARKVPGGCIRIPLSAHAA